VQLIKRTFIVPPGFFGAAAAQPNENGGVDGNALLAILKVRGITFPPGAAAAYLPASGKLVVVETPDQIELIAKLIRQAGGDPDTPDGVTAQSQLAMQPAPSASPAPPSNTQAGRVLIQHKLDSMVLSVDLKDATLDEAIQFLNLESKNLDPDHQGIHFVLSPDLVAKDRAPGTISLDLDNIPLGQLLRYIDQLANVTHAVKDDGVYFSPK